MEYSTKDFKRQEGSRALLANDTNSLARYKAARDQRRSDTARISSLEARVQELESKLNRLIETTAHLERY